MIFRNKTNILISLDKDARNFIDAAGLNTDSNLSVSGLYTAQEARMAIHLFVKGMKAIGTWDLCKAIYIFVGGTSTTHKFNLKDPRDLDAAFRLTYVGGVTHNSEGFNGDGTTGYAVTYLNPNSHLISSINLGLYTKSSQYDTNDCLGAYRVAEPAVRVIIRSSSFTNIATGLTSSTSNDRIDSSPILSKGYFTMNSNATALENWFNGILISGTSSSYGVTGKSTRNFTIGAIGEGTTQSQYSNRNFNYVSIGSGFTSLQNIQQSHLVEVFNASLNRSAFTR